MGKIIKSVQKMLDLEVFLYWFCYFDAICTKAIEMPIVYRYYEKAQNAHVRWNVLPRMIVGRWWFFLEKHWKAGWNEQDVCGRLPCMTALRYEPCKNRANSIACAQAPIDVFHSISAWLVAMLTFHLLRILHNIFVLHEIIDQRYYGEDQCDPHNNIGEDL